MAKFKRAGKSNLFKKTVANTTPADIKNALKPHSRDCGCGLDCDYGYLSLVDFDQDCVKTNKAVYILDGVLTVGEFSTVEEIVTSCCDYAAPSNPCAACEEFVNGTCVPKVCDVCEVCVNGICTAKTCGPCETCINGVCSTTCLFCETCVNGQCVSNCDVCSECTINGCQTKDCPPCHTCVNGICVYPCLDCETCDANEQCVSNCGPCEQCTSTGCVSACSDCEECVNGVCTPTCGPCETCVNGACVSSCTSCQNCVNGTCTNIVCPATCQSCVNGVCVDNCTTPDTTCVTPTLRTEGYVVIPWNLYPDLRNQCCECLHCYDCPDNLYCPTTASNALNSGGTLCKCGPQCTPTSSTSSMWQILRTSNGGCSPCFRVNNEIEEFDLRCVNGVITEKDNKRVCVECNRNSDCASEVFGLTCNDPLKQQKACVNKDCVCVECTSLSHCNTVCAAQNKVAKSCNTTNSTCECVECTLSSQCTAICQAQGFTKGTCSSTTNTCRCV